MINSLKFIVSIQLLFFLSGCESSMKTVEFLNASGQRVQISVEGIQLYHGNSGPQTLTGIVQPNGIQSCSAISSKPAIITFPVKVSWKSDSEVDYSSREIQVIDGLEPNKTKIYEAGTIVVGIDRKMQPRIFFVSGRGSNSSENYRILNEN